MASPILRIRNKYNHDITAYVSKHDPGNPMYYYEPKLIKHGSDNENYFDFPRNHDEWYCIYFHKENSGREDEDYYGFYIKSYSDSDEIRFNDYSDVRYRNRKYNLKGED